MASKRSLPMSRSAFHHILNTKVLTPILRQALTPTQVQDLVYGLSDLVLQLTLDGERIKLGNLGTFRVKVIPPGQCWNPIRQRKVKSGERRQLMFKAAKDTRRLINRR